MESAADKVNDQDRPKHLMKFIIVKLPRKHSISHRPTTESVSNRPRPGAFFIRVSSSWNLKYELSQFIKYNHTITGVRIIHVHEPSVVILPVQIYHTINRHFGPIHTNCDHSDSGVSLHSPIQFERLWEKLVKIVYDIYFGSCVSKGYNILRCH